MIIIGFWKKNIHDDLKEALKIKKLDEEFQLIIRNILNIIKGGLVPHDPKTEKDIYNFLKKIEKDINAARHIATNVSLRLNTLSKK